ncbi:class I SAM-dependent methyltransferase [Pseudonocardia kujensis]|uniref:class I SAM-dependent methyltransferase n=1 Tax=Pseudonocardia kujensis TaxID=1128675 RepID=UPI001E33CC78|nr:class I SAM-dependent methyltransferase [Pseudonocardia kujensis]MCE0766317.1 class I SAM-dependent methyltransferase [Pseudonocardia kujensis]
MADGPGTAASNAEQRAQWSGELGLLWAARAAQFEASAAGYDAALLEAAALGPGLYVLDVGCGTGSVTRKAAAAVAPGGTVTGVDISTPMLQVARDRSAELAGVTFLEVDAQVHDFAGRYDRVVSRAGVMFFGDPPVAFANLVRALRPGGRVAFLVWRSLAENAWLSDLLRAVLGRPPPAPPPGPGAFALADPQEARALLEGAGLAEVGVQPCAAPVVLGRDVEEAFGLVRRMLAGTLDGLGPGAQERAVANLRAVLTGGSGPDGVALASAAWLLTGRRSGPVAAPSP